MEHARASLGLPACSQCRTPMFRCLGVACPNWGASACRNDLLYTEYVGKLTGERP